MRTYGECGVVSRDKGVKRDGKFPSAGDGWRIIPGLYDTGSFLGNIVSYSYCVQRGVHQKPGNITLVPCPHRKLYEIIRNSFSGF